MQAAIWFVAQALGAPPAPALPPASPVVDVLVAPEPAAPPEPPTVALLPVVASTPLELPPSLAPPTLDVVPMLDVVASLESRVPPTPPALVAEPTAVRLAKVPLPVPVPLLAALVVPAPPLEVEVALLEKGPAALVSAPVPGAASLPAEHPSNSAGMTAQRENAVATCMG